MKKLFQISLLFLLCNLSLYSEEPEWQVEKMHGASECLSAEIDQYLEQKKEKFDGFLSGTLVKTIDGYEAIEQLKVGDVIVGKDGPQEILCTDSCEINGALYHSLTTEQHWFYVYPDKLVHNMDFAIITPAGTLLMGLVEIASPAVLLTVALVSLSSYAVKCYLQKGHFTTQREKVLQDSDIIDQTRRYYELSRNELAKMHKDLVIFKSSIAVFRGTWQKLIALSSMLSPVQYQPFKFPGLLSLQMELNLSPHDLEKLFLIRDQELRTLEDAAFEIELDLGFHLNEMIERRDQSVENYKRAKVQINKNVQMWNSHLYNMPRNIALAEYKSNIVWLKHLNNIKLKVDELQQVVDFYKQNNNHFFVSSRASNLLVLLESQLIENDEVIGLVNRSNPTCMSNIKVNEDFLRRSGLLSPPLVNQFLAEAQAEVTAQEQSAPIYFEKKKKGAKQKKKKLLEDRAKSGASGGFPDPEDEDEFKKKHPNGKYENNPKHHKNSKNGVGKPPRDGQSALDRSVYVAMGLRFTIEDGKFIALREHLPGKFHGYIIKFCDIDDTVKSILFKKGLIANINGRISK